MMVSYLNCGSPSYHLTRLEGGMDASQMKHQVSTVRPECCGEGSRSEGKVQKDKTSERPVFLGGQKKWDPWEGRRDWPKRGGLAHVVQ